MWNWTWREKSLTHSSPRTFSFNSKIIDKFDSIVGNGKKSKVVEFLISQFINMKKPERERIFQATDIKSTSDKKGDFIDK